MLSSLNPEAFYSTQLAPFETGAWTVFIPVLTA